MTTALQSLGHRINLLIAERECGLNVQPQIDALMIQLEAMPEAVSARASANVEDAQYARLYA